MQIKLEIPGEPMGKQRPKFNRFTKSAHTPEKTVNYEAYVKSLYVANRLPLLEGYIEADIAAYYSIPKSASKKKKEQMLLRSIRPTKAPDADNIAKIVLDSLNGVAYKDDSQVVTLHVEKFYSDRPRVVLLLHVEGTE